jgi:hypothetical protein
MKAQKTANSQVTLSKKSNAGGITMPDFKLQSRSNKNSMVLAQKQT